MKRRWSRPCSALRDLFDLQTNPPTEVTPAGGYVFAYDPATLAELDAVASEGPER